MDLDEDFFCEEETPIVVSGGSPPRKPPRLERTGYSWGSSFRFVNYVGDISDSQGIPSALLVATDSPQNLGSYGSQTDELYLVNKEEPLRGVSYWEGRLAWYSQDFVYAVLIEGNVPDRGISYLSPSMFNRKPEPIRIENEQLWDLSDQKNKGSTVFYDHFAELIEQNSALPMNQREIDLAHTEYTPLDMNKLVSLWKLRQWEEKGWKPTSDFDHDPFTD